MDVSTLLVMHQPEMAKSCLIIRADRLDKINKSNYLWIFKEDNVSMGSDDTGEKLAPWGVNWNIWTAHCRCFDSVLELLLWHKDKAQKGMEWRLRKLTDFWEASGENQDDSYSILKQ
jgi:hypothetical protein